MDATQLQQQITEVFDHFSKLLSQLSEEILNNPPKQGSWTIGQLAQHVTLATSGLPDTQTRPAERKPDELEPAIKEIFLNFEKKAISPEFISPEKKIYKKDSLLEELQQNKISLLKSIKEKEMSDLCMDMELPGLGKLTRYEWIKLVIYHVQRHTVQLKKLKQSFEKASI